MFGRAHRGTAPTQEQAELIAELVVAYAFAQLLMGTIADSETEWHRLARLIAAN